MMLGHATFIALSPPATMPATELFTTSAGKVGEKELLIPSGKEGEHFAHVQDWITRKLKARRPVKDVSQQVLVKGIKQWAVFEEKAGGKLVRTVFKIT